MSLSEILVKMANELINSLAFKEMACKLTFDIDLETIIDRSHDAYNYV